jgi:hypothetical protein
MVSCIRACLSASFNGTRNHRTVPGHEAFLESLSYGESPTILPLAGMWNFVTIFNAVVLHKNYVSPLNGLARVLQDELSCVMSNNLRGSIEMYPAPICTIAAIHRQSCSLLTGDRTSFLTLDVPTRWQSEIAPQVDAHEYCTRWNCSDSHC